MVVTEKKHVARALAEAPLVERRHMGHDDFIDFVCALVPREFLLPSTVSTWPQPARRHLDKSRTCRRPALHGADCPRCNPLSLHGAGGAYGNDHAREFSGK